MRILSIPTLLLLAGLAPAQGPLQTTAEATKFEKTSSSQEVIDFCQRLAKESPKVKYTTYGKTVDGKPLPLLIVADPPVASPEDMLKTSKPVVFVTANIHAGEVDGKEAVLAFARDLVAEKDSAILKKLVVLIAPNFNPDGNDKFSDKLRTSQNGPKFVGTRANSDNFDLNRDFVKLETPETRGIVSILNAWKPIMVIDCHTTNGSYHRYTLTYDGPRLPAADAKLIDYARDTLFPAVSEKVKKATGFESFTYGDFDKDHEQWLTYGSGPRYGTQLYSLRGSLGVLSESYTYASFEDRVKASYAFVKGNFEFVAENTAEISKLVRDAQKPRAKVALRTKTVAREKPLTVFGWVEEAKDGKIIRTEKPKDYTCRIIDKLVPTVEVDRPFAYLIPPEYTAAIQTLQRHGIPVVELREQIELDVETYTVTEAKSANEFQKHKLRTVEVKSDKGTFRPDAGSFLVRADGQLGMLASYLLEPQAEDGMTAWNFFDAGIQVNAPFPVRRLLKDSPMYTGSPKPLPEKMAAKKHFGDENVGGRGAGNLGGAPVGAISWLPDGEHWLQNKSGKQWKIHARTGRAEPFLDPEILGKSLAALKQLDARETSGFLASTNYRFNSDRTAILYPTAKGISLVKVDGSPAIELVAGTGIELATFSPDGKWVGYVQAGNLFAVSTTDPKRIQFTTDGGKNEILNGRADWVYEEEIFNRNPNSFWWSPDSKAIAFLRYDDSKVPKFTLANADGKPESINYPKAGQANPTVKIGVVTISDSKVEFLNLGNRKPDDTLIARVGWMPGATPKVFAYVQNRIQNYLDFTVWPSSTESGAVLFHETTKAWVEDLGEPKFLADGSFLILSERGGYKHLYRYGADGKLIAQITDGNWEVKHIERIDEESGDIYFTGTKVRSTASHLAYVSLKGGDVQVLSAEKTTHTISLAPKGSLYIDRATDDFTPTQTILRELYAKPIRILDTNPAYEREQYIFGRYERKTIKLKDGFELEAGITYPPDFHEYNRYPIWILTYAGPHAPTLKDGWGNGRVFEQVLAASGIVVMRVDPRSASGKGAISSWACYKQLGVQELKDLEESVDWIGKNAWADTSRVGLSGHSYGGFMASYALTHSTKFSAGIAGAPVTDWNYYDSIYTERYMGLPSENKEGYDKTSVVKAAKDLNGKLLIVHGLIDDNVHPQNSMKLISALQAAGKEFEAMVYPGSRHGIMSPHYPKSQLQFIRRTMGVAK